MDFSKAKTSVILLRYVIPQMIGLVFNSIYFIVDGIFIGKRLGTAALAAAGVGVPVVEIMIALSMLISVGTGVIISINLGSGDKEKAVKVFNLSNAAALIFVLCIVIFGNIFIVPLAKALGATDLIIDNTIIYLRYFISFCPFLLFSFVLGTYARNDHRPRLAMWALTIGSLSNILLDYVFMYPLNMGIAGAALATGLGPVFSVIILLPHFLMKKGQLVFKKPVMCGKTLINICTNGLSAFVSEFSIGFVTLLYNLFIIKNGFGDNGLASYLVIGYAALICLTALIGASQGIQPAVSFYTGSGEKSKIKALFISTLLFNIILAICFYLLLFFAGHYFFTIFINDNYSLVIFTAEKAKIYFTNLIFAAANILIISFLQSMEKSKLSLVLSLSRSTIPVIVFLIILPYFFGQNGIWFAVTASEICTFIFVLFSTYITKKNS